LSNRHAEQLLHHLAVAHLVGRPANAGGDLVSSQPARLDAERLRQQAEVLARRVRQCLDRRVGHQVDTGRTSTASGSIAATSGASGSPHATCTSARSGHVAVLRAELEVERERPAAAIVRAMLATRSASATRHRAGFVHPTSRVIVRRDEPR
jgi:hypothetical protein